MIKKRILAKLFNTLLVLILIVLSCLLLRYEETKDYFYSSLISFSVVCFLPVSTIGASLGYSLFHLLPSKKNLLLFKYILIYLFCFILPIITSRSGGLALVLTYSAVLVIIGVESIFLLFSSRGKCDLLDLFLGIHYNGHSYSLHSWHKGALLLVPVFSFFLSFTISADLCQTLLRRSHSFINANLKHEPTMYFEWDLLSGLCNSIFVIEETSPDFCYPLDIESIFRKKEKHIWTVYASCNKYSIMNYDRRFAIAQEIAASLRLSQFDADSIPDLYRLRMYYTKHSTPFSTENICYEYYIDPQITSISGGIDINLILDYHKSLHDDYSQLVIQTLRGHRYDSLLNLYVSGRAVQIPPEIEESIMEDLYSRPINNSTTLTFPITPFKMVEPIHNIGIGISYPFGDINLASITKTREKQVLDAYREKEMPYSYYYLGYLRLVSMCGE